MTRVEVTCKARCQICMSNATFVNEMQFDFLLLLSYDNKYGYAKRRSTPSRFFCNRRIHP